MAGIDKAAIGWTIAIVAAGVGIAVAGPSFDSGSSTSFTAPSITAPSTSEDKIAAAKETIAQEQQERMESTSVMDEQKEETMEETVMEEAHEEETVMEEAHEEEAHEEETVMEEAPAEPQIHVVSMPVGAGIPGCEETNMCYDPTDLTINVGDTVIWNNDDGQIPHTVTSGDLAVDPNTVGFDYPNGFDSQFMQGGTSYEFTFEASGTYPYFCQLHPWMVGTVQVE